jgi:nicotinate-nucleotide adenylyltransferase
MEISCAKVIYYGGSFNPPTLAHEGVIRLLAETYKTSCIKLLPNGNLNPENKTLAPLDLRAKWLRQIASQFPNVHVSLLSAALAPESKGRIFHLIPLLEPNPMFVIGGDQVRQIKTWYRWEDVVNAFHFIVVARDIPFKADVLNVFPKITVLENPYASALSSTSVRNLLATNNLPEAMKSLPKCLRTDMSDFHSYCKTLSS